jgi:hypothetical protein
MAWRCKVSDIDDQMAEWRKTLWGTGPCPDSSQENFTLTDEEREAVEDAVSRYVPGITPRAEERAATLRALLERTK